MQTKIIQINHRLAELWEFDKIRPVRKLIIISHGRFLAVQRYLSSTADVAIPPGVKVFHYTRHGEKISSDRVRHVFQHLIRSFPVESVKDYGARETFKNYTLEARDNIRYPVISESHCDILYPLQPVTVQNIFHAVRQQILPYNEIHFISCRAYRLTRSGII